MQACTSLQTDNHTSTPPLSFLQAGCPSCCPTVKALKACTRLLFITDFHAGVVLLRRFAQFFVEPLFTASATEREVNAVNSENDKNLQNDTWRLNQLDKSTAKPGHPYTKFGTGKMSHHVESSPYSLCLFNLAFWGCQNPVNSLFVSDLLYNFSNPIVACTTVSV